MLPRVLYTSAGDARRTGSARMGVEAAGRKEGEAGEREAEAGTQGEAEAGGGGCNKEDHTQD